MPTNLPKATVKFLIALLKHQAENLLGKDAAGILGDDVQQKIDDWLKSEKTEKDLLKAAQQAQIFLQDRRNCPDDDLRYFFRDVGFGDLPAVQEALAELPQAMDASGVTDALRESFRSFSTLSASQQEEGAKLYTEALLRAAGTLEPFTLPIIHKVVQENSRKLDTLGVGQAEIKALLEKLSSVILPPSFFKFSPTQKGDLPPGSYLPIQPNPNFTGRVDELRQLAEALCSEEESGMRAAIAINQQALVGMGGIGKTQLAVQFAWEYGYRFAGVHWVNAYQKDKKGADTSEVIAASIAQCGREMGVPFRSQDIEQQAADTIKAWKESGPRLVIFDNLEDMDAVAPWMARLRHSNVRLLITTRHHDLIQRMKISSMTLKPFTPNECHMFLRKNLTVERADDDDLRTLSQNLNYMPIDLDRAVYHLKRYANLTVKEYLKQIRMPSARTKIMSDFPIQKTTIALQFLKTQEEMGVIPKQLADVYRTRILNRWFKEFFG